MRRYGARRSRVRAPVRARRQRQARRMAVELDRTVLAPGGHFVNTRAMLDRPKRLGDTRQSLEAAIAGVVVDIDQFDGDAGLLFQFRSDQVDRFIRSDLDSSPGILK